MNTLSLLAQMFLSYRYDFGRRYLEEIFPVLLIPSLVFTVLGIIAIWRIFTKAGQPGWAAIIPLYNLYTFFKITWGNGWFFLLMLIPLVNIVIMILTMVKLAQAFGRGGGFAAGLIFFSFIFMLILAFGQTYYYYGVPGRDFQV
ncbi:MAG: DUF5684 domain-containing protein [Bacillota bacterium]|nr:DUF5684 domain-containing protein [Bacillota bacterium]